MIYLDNAATTMKKPQCVIDAVVNAMTHMGNAGRGANEASLDASRIIYDTREKISDLVNLKNPSRVAFTCNSTESLNTAIKGILTNEDHAITTSLEHNSVLRPLYELEEKGMELSVVQCDENGNINYDDFEKLIKEKITKKSRIAILQIKSQVCDNPKYHKEFSSVDIYEAVLLFGVKDIEGFREYLAKKGKNL